MPSINEAPFPMVEREREREGIRLSFLEIERCMAELMSG